MTESKGSTKVSHLEYLHVVWPRIVDLVTSRVKLVANLFFKRYLFKVKFKLVLFLPYITWS